MKCTSLFSDCSSLIIRMTVNPHITLLVSLFLVIGFASAKEGTCPFVDSSVQPGQVAGIAAYSYSRRDRNGPPRWGDLDCSSPDFAKFSSCPHCGPSSCDGKSQSPINILTYSLEDKSVKNAPKINLSTDAEMEYKIASGNFVLNCKSEGTCGDVSFNGKTYYLSKLHMHFRSEHLLNYRRYPIELHFVHVSKSGELLVVSKFFRKKRRGYNSEFQTFLDIACTKSSDYINLSLLLGPASSNLMVYSGSLTTPPCTEGVTFVISSYIGTVARDQLNELKRLCGGMPKNRPMQALNGRTVSIYK